MYREPDKIISIVGEATTLWLLKLDDIQWM